MTTSQGETSLVGTVTLGCPQSGVGNFVVDELLEKIEQQRCQIVGYAVNGMIIVRGPFLSTLIKKPQRIVRDLVC